MSSFFRTLFFSKISKSITPQSSHWWFCKASRIVDQSASTIHRRNSSAGKVQENETLNLNPCMETPFVRFDDMIASRRAEAKSSILVQVQSESSITDLCSYCNQFGNIKTMNYFSVRSKNFILVEFCEEESVKAVLQDGTHAEEPVIPVRSPLLWFRAEKKIIKKLFTSQDDSPVPIPCSFPKVMVAENSEIYKLLLKAETISDQMMTLYLHSRLNDMGCKLRFFTARQVELLLLGIFPRLQALPFGSTVNSFGKMGCDLDLSILFDDSKGMGDSRLVFQAKTSQNQRTSVQRQMEVIGDLIQLLLPGCSHVRKILQARVPIIKYNQDLTSVECDLSMTNTTAFYMSELLYMFGHIDWRVRPLVFTVRWWAKELYITNPMQPGISISNFTLTLLVIFFLQRKKILPSLDLLVSHAGIDDKRITEEGVDCTFLRDLSKLPATPERDEKSLAELLIEFFDYYACFDFVSRAISINLGKCINKPEPAAPMYVVNPLERHLNVTKNMNSKETTRLKFEARKAASRLSQQFRKEESGQAKLGILRLTPAQKKIPDDKYFAEYFETPSTPLKNERRLVSVEQLFVEEDRLNQDSPESEHSEIVDTIHPSSNSDSNIEKSAKPKTAMPPSKPVDSVGSEHSNSVGTFDSSSNIDDTIRRPAEPRKLKLPARRRP